MPTNLKLPNPKGWGVSIFSPPFHTIGVMIVFYSNIVAIVKEHVGSNSNFNYPNLRIVVRTPKNKKIKKNKKIIVFDYKAFLYYPWNNPLSKELFYSQGLK